MKTIKKSQINYFVLVKEVCYNLSQITKVIYYYKVRRGGIL